MKFTGRRIKIYDGVRQYAKPFTKHIVGLGILKLLLLLLGVTTPLFFKLLVDNVMVKRQLDVLVWVCIGYISIYVVESFALLGQKILSNRVFNKVTFDIRFKLWHIYTKMPVVFFEKYNTGDLKNRIDNDADTFEKFFNRQIVDYIYNWGLIIVNGIVLTVINWKLSFFGFLMVPVSFWMTKWLGKEVKKSSGEYRSIWGKYENWLQGSIQGWKEVKALAIEKNESRIFTKYWHELCKKFFRKQMYWFGNKSFISIKDFFITRMNLYFIGGLLIFNGELTIGSLLVFMQYYNQFFGGIGNINNLDMEINNDIPAIDRVLELMDIPVDNKKGLVLKERLKGNIELSDVNFKYNNNQSDILKKINLKIKAGERIAIVGKSGCGKTTLLKLILRLYNPQSGSITIDGYDMNTINSICLHQNMGVVMQDSFLFNLSIKDNMLLAKPSATDDEIKKACQMASIDTFIESLTDKYMTLIGEKGVKLSGGQKQRLAIARVLLSNPGIVIFDEATSSLDNVSEKMVHQAIDRVSRNKTVIIVAHRLSSVLSADRVIVLENGNIVGDGHHRSLLGTNKTYDLLFKRQYESTKVL